MPCLSQKLKRICCAGKLIKIALFIKMSCRFLILLEEKFLLFQILFFIGQTTVLYSVCIALTLLGYIFLSLSNADVRLAKELKIECSYENKVNRTNSTKLRNELKLLRQVLLENSTGLSPSRASSFISRPRWKLSLTYLGISYWIVI